MVITEEIWNELVPKDQICPVCNEPYLNHSVEKGEECYEKYVENEGMSEVFDRNRSGEHDKS